MCSINTSAKLFRCKIFDQPIRRALLENSKKLKDTEFGRVYINKDLTYNQRQELYRRRQQRRSDSGSVPNTQPQSGLISQRDSVPLLPQGDADLNF